MRNIQCTVDEKNEEKDQFDNFLGVNPLNLGIKNFPGTPGKVWSKYEVSRTIFLEEDRISV